MLDRNDIIQCAEYRHSKNGFVCKVVGVFDDSVGVILGIHFQGQRKIRNGSKRYDEYDLDYFMENFELIS